MYKLAMYNTIKTLLDHGNQYVKFLGSLACAARPLLESNVRF